MSYKINYTVFRDYIKVTLEGTGGKENIPKISADVSALVEKYGITNIMVDCRKLEGRLGIFDTLEYIENYPPEMKLRRYAIIDRTEHKQGNDFFENAAINRGFSIYYFYNEEDAMRCLNILYAGSPEEVMEKEY